MQVYTKGLNALNGHNFKIDITKCVHATATFLPHDKGYEISQILASWHTIAIYYMLGRAEYHCLRCNNNQAVI